MSISIIKRNFQGEEFHDTICITANPYYQHRHRLDTDTFYKVIDTGSEDPQEAMEKTTTAAIDAHKENPNKRLLIHYMPPHTPHMGKTSKQVRNSFASDHNLFEAYKNGLVSRDTLEKSYIETVRIIESEVKELIPQLNGKTVVSSDHGENLGERKHGIVWLAHGNETKECRIVPWLEMPYDERREVIEDTPVSHESVDENEVESRLEHLGYV